VNASRRLPKHNSGERVTVNTMQTARQHIVDVLRRAGYTEVADEAMRLLPDPVDLDHVAVFLAPYGITKDGLISVMGGSP
jgi:hypothetical protein